MTKKLIVRVVSILFLPILLAMTASGQSNSPDFDRMNEMRFKNAKNRWMLNATDVRSQHDYVTEAERLERDRYADQHWGADRPLSLEPNAEHSGIGEPIGTPKPGNPDFLNGPDYVWLIGKFESYSSFLSSSQRCVYTEIRYRVQHVFGRGQNLPQEGALVDTVIRGGTIIAPWSAKISFQVEPLAHAPQPSHTYLLMLWKQKGLYVAARRWDITNGVVEPDTDAEILRAKQGKSEISGLTVSQLIDLLDKKFKSGKLEGMVTPLAPTVRELESYQ